MNTIQQAFRALRAYSPTKPAARVLETARAVLARPYDAKNKSKAYRAACFGYSPAGAPFGGSFWPLGSSQMVWVEKPDAQGMRDCGSADEIAPRRVQHRGWYIDNDQCETVRGCVVRWGRYYVPALRDPHNDGPIMLAWSDREPCADAGTSECGDNHALRHCACRADALAEMYAENEREHDAAYSAGSQWRDLRDEARELRAKIRATLAEVRQTRPATEPESVPDPYRAICAALREKVGDWLADLQSLRQKRAKLAAGDYVADWLPGFSTRDESHVSAFCEGAGIAPAQFARLA